MNLPDLKDPKSPWWPVIRLIAITVVGVVAFNLFYSHGFDPQKDGASLASFLVAIGGIDTIKHFVTGNADSGQNGQ